MPHGDDLEAGNRRRFSDPHGRITDETGRLSEEPVESFGRHMADEMTPSVGINLLRLPIDFGDRLTPWILAGPENHLRPNRRFEDDVRIRRTRVKITGIRMEEHHIKGHL